MLAGNIYVYPSPTEAISWYLANHVQIAVIVDNNTKQYCYPKLAPYLPAHFLIEIEDGEINKNIETCSHIWGKLTDLQFDRKALVINLGGGVIGDIGGFCASTFKRGIDFIQMPTTLLAMADASVGGKLGFDFGGFKNQIGIYNKPDAIFIHTEFLSSLPKEHIQSGFAEIVKHALIKNANKYNEITKVDIDNEDWRSLVEFSINTKYAIVQEDMFEKGERRTLNFGHTIGHAIETFFLDTDTPMLHGHCIAAGMICEVYLSKVLGRLREEEAHEVIHFLSSSFKKLPIKEEQVGAISEITMQDKKNEHGQLRVTFLEKIGVASYNNASSLKDIKEALRFYIAN